MRGLRFFFSHAATLARLLLGSYQLLSLRQDLVPILEFLPFSERRHVNRNDPLEADSRGAPWLRLLAGET